MIVLVCGGRNYNDRYAVDSALSSLHASYPITAIVQGEAPGADRRGKEWAMSNGIPLIGIPAQWGAYGNRKAGPVRNMWMLQFVAVGYCVAFPGGSGTADMVAKCDAHQIPVWRPYD